MATSDMCHAPPETATFPMCYGPEFVSRALLKWIADQGIETALIDPGKPWRNGALESLSGKFRDECLSMEWFRSRGEASTDQRSSRFRNGPVGTIDSPRPARSRR